MPNLPEPNKVDAEYSVVFVGAGPQNLASFLRLLARLSDNASLDDGQTTDLYAACSQGIEVGERTYFERLRHANSTAEHQAKRRQVNHKLTEQIAIIDSRTKSNNLHGWMEAWCQQLSAMEVDFLRSTITAHVNPSDRGSLLAHCWLERDRAETSSESLRCAKALEQQVLHSKRSNARRARTKRRRRRQQRCLSSACHDASEAAIMDTSDFNASALPEFSQASRDSFTRFISATLERFDAARLCSGPLRDTVTQIVPEFRTATHSGGTPSSFLLRLQSGKTLRAARVVVGVGLSTPRLPTWVRDMTLSDERRQLLAADSADSASPLHGVASHGAAIVHTDHLMYRFGGVSRAWTDALLNRPTNSTGNSTRRHIVVIGGGQTAANVCLTLARAPQAPRVTLLHRSELRARHFDANLPWYGRRSGARLLEQFLDAPLTQRGQLLTDAVRASVSFATLEALRAHSNIEVREHTTVTCATPTADGRHLSLQCTDCTEAAISPLQCDALVLATGRERDIRRDPMFRDLLAQHPVPLDPRLHLPHLTPQLQWQKNWQLYVNGALASLAAGPNSGNLNGAYRNAVVTVDAMLEDGTLRNQLTTNAASVAPNIITSQVKRAPKTQNSRLRNTYEALLNIE